MECKDYGHNSVEKTLGELRGPGRQELVGGTSGGRWSTEGKRRPKVHTTGKIIHTSRISSVPHVASAPLAHFTSPTALTSQHLVLPLEGPKAERAGGPSSGVIGSERGPALMPSLLHPRRRLAAGETCAPGGRAQGAGRRGNARAVFLRRERARAGAGGRCGKPEGRGRGAGRGSWERASSAAAGRVRVCEAAAAHRRAQIAASRGCEQQGAAALLSGENSGSSDLSNGRARGRRRRRRAPRDPQGPGAGGRRRGNAGRRPGGAGGQ